MGFELEIRLKSHSDFDEDFIIPKGQVFENAKLAFRYQNLIAAETVMETIPAGGFKTIRFRANCINPPYCCPNGGKGKLTIYQYGVGKTYANEIELDRAIRDNTRDFSSRWQSFRNSLRLNSAYHRSRKTREKLLGAVTLLGAVGLGLLLI